MTTIVDGWYDLFKVDAQWTIYGIYTSVSHSFTANGGTLNSCKFIMNKSGSPTGNCYAKIYAHSGTYGTSSVRDGDALATSDAVDVSTLPNIYQTLLITFIFSGANKITLTDGVYYCVAFYYDGGDASNHPHVRASTDNSCHSGNDANYANTSSASDITFYVYKDDVISSSASMSASLSLSPSASGSASESVSESKSGSKSESASPSPSASVSKSASASGSRSLSVSFSASASSSGSASESKSLSPSFSESASASKSESASASASLSASASESKSESKSESASESKSTSASISNSASASESISESKSESPSASLSPSASPSVIAKGKNVIRVALPGYDALTDTDPDHFALYSDEDWVLIKEKLRGSVEIADQSSTSITHNLGYIPFWAVYANNEWVYGDNLYGEFKAYATTSNLVLFNISGSNATFKYYIFYDKQV